MGVGPLQTGACGGCHRREALGPGVDASWRILDFCQLGVQPPETVPERRRQLADFRTGPSQIYILPKVC